MEFKLIVPTDEAESFLETIRNNKDVRLISIQTVKTEILVRADSEEILREAFGIVPAGPVGIVSVPEGRTRKFSLFDGQTDEIECGVIIG